MALSDYAMYPDSAAIVGFDLEINDIDNPAEGRFKATIFAPASQLEED